MAITAIKVAAIANCLCRLRSARMRWTDCCCQEAIASNHSPQVRSTLGGFELKKLRGHRLAPLQLTSALAAIEIRLRHFVSWDRRTFE